jgi:hypothetical protein
VNSESLTLVQTVAGRSSASDLRRSGQLEAKVTELFNLLHRPVLRYVLAILVDQGTAEDVTQDDVLEAVCLCVEVRTSFIFERGCFKLPIG